MALARSILAMITDGKGHASSAFLTTTPEQWADAQMLVRYGNTLVPDEPSDSPARRAHALLKDERKALGGWFDEAGKLQPLLQCMFLTNKLHGPLGDGFGWDFRANGDPEPRMLLFKGTLIAAARSASLLPLDQRSRGSMQFGGIATIVRSAYTERAALHSWQGVTKPGPLEPSRRAELEAKLLESVAARETDLVTQEELKAIAARLRSAVKVNRWDIDPAEMSRRWVSFQTFTFLMRLGAEADWAWTAANCPKVYGPWDEPMSLSRALQAS